MRNARGIREISGRIQHGRVGAVVIVVVLREGEDVAAQSIAYCTPRAAVPTGNIGNLRSGNSEMSASVESRGVRSVAIVVENRHGVHVGAKCGIIEVRPTRTIPPRDGGDTPIGLAAGVEVV